jgi:NAD+ synthase
MYQKKELSMVDTNSIHDVLKFDQALEIKKITESIRKTLRTHLKRRGLVVAISGGIDSSVSAALCVKALGSEKVFGLLLPETDSSSKSSRRGKMLAEHLNINYLVVDIAKTLEAIGCYQWRDEAIKEIFVEYEKDWKNKIIIDGGANGKINHFHLVVQSPDGKTYKKRLDLKNYLQIVAATNFKQRIRKTMEFFHADRLNYAVVGTPNRVEYDQGFFVKNGDGSADIKPIAHLYKTQVYSLARYLGLPDEICDATPTTDTYSLAQGQDEFYYSLPFDKMDLALWAHNQKLPAKDLAKMIDITVEQAVFVYKDINNKRTTTAMLHWPALLVEKVEGPIPKPE